MNDGEGYLWATREQALSSLTTSLKGEADLIEGYFNLIDESIEYFQEKNTKFSRTYGLSLIKARNLALACLSLSLDGLAQEAGAIVRPLIEVLELLQYFREDPLRVNEAIEERLPPAGEIAKKIKGEFKDLRASLNTHASHFSFTFESVRHLVNFQERKWEIIQPHRDEVLRVNLLTLFKVMANVIVEVIECRDSVGDLDDSFVMRAGLCQARGEHVFHLDG